MVIACPCCGARPALADTNVATDLALCRGCGEAFRISEAANAPGAAAPKVLRKAPPGAWFTEHADGFEVGATTRSPVAFVLVPFMLVWAGASMGGIYGRQLATGHFELHRSLLGIPFLLGSILFGSIAVMTVAGRCVVSVRGGGGAVFLGVRNLGWTRRFRWPTATNVTQASASTRYPGGHDGCVRLVADRQIDFGTGVSEERRTFLLEALLFMMARRDRVPDGPPYRGVAQ